MSGPSKAKMSDKLKLPTANQYTSWGENEKVRYRTAAQTYSKNGFMIQIKGVSPTCLLSGIEIVQPVQVRWRRNHANARTAGLIVPNLYSDISDVKAGANAGQVSPDGQAAAFFFDGIQIRPNALMRSARSCTISYNGRSFCTRCNQYISGVERVFCDGGKESVYGWPYAKYPFSNMAHPSRALREPGRFARARDLASDAYVPEDEEKQAYYTGGSLADVFFQYNIRSKLWFGPFIADAFPEMMQSLDGNSSGSLPYLSSLVIEVNYEQNPLLHWFCYPGHDASNRLGAMNPYNPVPNAVLNLADTGLVVPDLDMMWKNVYQGKLQIQTAADAPVDAVRDQCVGLLAPYAEYTFVEQSPMMPVPAQVPIASKSFVCYEDMQQITDGNPDTTFTFSNIKVNQISQLYMCYVEAADTDVGTARGARRAKWSTGAAVPQHLGGAYSVVFAPIDWSSVRVMLSTKNQVLGNFGQEKLGISEKSQYEKFLKYSGDRCGMSFKEWRESSQMILFSAQDLNLDVFSGQHDPLSLTISFRARRLVTDDSISARILASDDINAARDTLNVNLMGRLVMVQQQEVTIFDGGCEVKSVFWDPEVARRAAQASLGRRDTIADGPPKSALSGYK